MLTISYSTYGNADVTARAFAARAAYAQPGACNSPTALGERRGHAALR